MAPTTVVGARGVLRGYPLASQEVDWNHKVFFDLGGQKEEEPVVAHWATRWVGTNQQSGLGVPPFLYLGPRHRPLKGRLIQLLPAQ